MPDDDGLLDAFTRTRDEAAFRRLYRRHTPMLFGLALRLCASHAEAEELTQEAWVRAVRQHDAFNRRSRYSTWVAGILVNCFREAARRHARAPLPIDDERQPDAAAVIAFPSRDCVIGDRLDVERALTRLPPGYREIVILHDVNGHTHEEIGHMLGIAEGTSKSQLARGRARLRELLSEPPDGTSGHGERGYRDT